VEKSYQADAAAILHDICFRNFAYYRRIWTLKNWMYCIWYRIQKQLIVLRTVKTDSLLILDMTRFKYRGLLFETKNSKNDEADVVLHIFLGQNFPYNPILVLKMQPKVEFSSSIHHIFPHINSTKLQIELSNVATAHKICKFLVFDFYITIILL